MNEWRSIETAPKDGTELLGYDARCEVFYLFRWSKHNHIQIYGWVWQLEKFGEEVDGCDPTHWMPLPPSPSPSPAVEGTK